MAKKKKQRAPVNPELELEMEEDLANVKAKDQSCKAFWLNNSGLFVGACATAPF